MRSATCFHSDDTRLKFGEKLCNAIPPQCLLQNNLILSIDTVNLKNLLGQIEADPTNLHGTYPPVSCPRLPHLGATGSIPLPPCREDYETTLVLLSVNYSRTLGSVIRPSISFFISKSRCLRKKVRAHAPRSGGTTWRPDRDGSGLVTMKITYVNTVYFRDDHGTNPQIF